MATVDRQEMAALRSGTVAGRAAAWAAFDPIGRLWRLFTSVRLALVLILVIAAAVLAGTLLDQAPAPVAADRDLYQQWLERVRDRYGMWTDVLAFFHLFTVFHSLWFRILLALLVANIIVCSLNRWKGVWATVFGSRVQMSDAFFRHARYNATFAVSMPVDVAAQRVQRALAQAGYRVQREAGGSSVAIYADRNRLSRFGTFLIHLSIVLILVGAVVGSIWGFRDNEFIVPEGAVREVGHGTGISVKLEHFTDEYYVEGPPKDFRSELVIFENGVEVKRGTTHVNSPLSYKGYKFHQAFFGQTAIMRVQDSSGEVLFEDAVPLAWQARGTGRPLGDFLLPQKGLHVYVIGPAAGENDPLIPAGEMRVEVYKQGSSALVTSENVTQGTPKELSGLTFTFVRESRFTGLKVVKDPGMNLIWIASALMIAGLVAMFYLPHRRVWASCRTTASGQSEVRLATPAQRDLTLERAFATLRERVALALGSNPVSSAAEGGRSDV